MTYAELRQALLDYSHRPDLTANTAGFVRLTEGLIRRELRAYDTTVTLDESDRVDGGVYTLPDGVSEIRAIYATDTFGQAYSLEQVSLAVIRKRSSAAKVAEFAVRGRQIEFRGHPATDAEFEIEYFGWPTALSADADTNDVLTYHEAVYLYGGLFHLYQFTQDTELAQGALDTFNDAIEKLNQQIGRKLGGANIAPAYNFAPMGGGY